MPLRFKNLFTRKIMKQSDMDRNIVSFFFFLFSFLNIKVKVIIKVGIT